MLQVMGVPFVPEKMPDNRRDRHQLLMEIKEAKMGSGDNKGWELMLAKRN